MAEWRPVRDGWIICDPTLDDAINALPMEVSLGILDGKNYSNAQVKAIKARLSPQAEKNV